MNLLKQRVAQVAEGRNVNNSPSRSRFEKQRSRRFITAEVRRLRLHIFRVSSREVVNLASESGAFSFGGQQLEPRIRIHGCPNHLRLDSVQHTEHAVLFTQNPQDRRRGIDA